MIKLLFYIFCLPFVSFANAPHPFNYDLNVVELEGNGSKTMICMHGLGSNYKIAQTLKEQEVFDGTLIAFNFPDHDLKSRKLGRKEIKTGTIEELLPAIYVLKEQVIQKNLDSVDLYGFSAGGGALINMLAVLNSSTYENELATIGVGVEEKAKILSAIENGLIILDAPLKSIEESIALRGWSFKKQFLANRYKKNGLRPIDSLGALKGLNLNILVYFEKPDEMLNNRDDALFAEKLFEVNPNGETTIVFGQDGGHFAFHKTLWQEHNKLLLD